MRSEDEIREFHDILKEAMRMLKLHGALMPEYIVSDMTTTHDVLCWVLGNENEKLHMCREAMFKLVEHLKRIDAADHSATVN